MGPLRGRETERAELSRLVAAAVDGAGGAVIVEGAAGIGKSRLLSEAAQIATDAGVLVAAGTSDELDQVSPWGPLITALSSTSPMLVSTADLAPLRLMVDQRLAVIDCIRTALEQSSRRRPLLVTLDDLQWADPATLLALGTLPSQLFSYPIGWVFARRTAPASQQLQTLTARLVEAGTSRLHLGPLEQDAATELAADILGCGLDAKTARLVAQAEGNPFYIVELMRGSAESAARNKDARPGGATAPSVPASLRSAVAAQLRALPQPSRDCLKVASVLGSEFTAAELVAMTGQSASQLLSALEPSLQAEVLTERGGRLAFRHDLLRQAVYQSLPGALRSALHRDAAVVLRDSGAPLVRVAGQFAAGAQPGDEDAIEVLAAAVNDLTGTAPAAAADLALQVLHLLGPDDKRRPAATARAVGLLDRCGRANEARDLGESYLARHKIPAAFQAEIEFAMRHAWTGQTSVPYPRPLPAGLLSDSSVPQQLRAALMANTQVGALWSGSEQEVDETLRRAAQILPDNDRAQADVIAIRTSLAHQHGRISAALDIASSDLTAENAEPSPMVVAGQLTAIAMCQRGLGQPAAALSTVERALAAASACGYTVMVAGSLCVRSTLLLELGRVDDARNEARGAASLAEDLGFRYFLGQAITALTEAALRQGDLTEAKAAAERLRRHSELDRQASDQRWAAALCADAAGRTDLAATLLEEALQRVADGHLLVAAWYPSRLPAMASLAARAGENELAGIAAKATAVIAERNPGLNVTRAAAAHARGVWQADAEALQEAVELLAAGERPLATAAAAEDLGRVLASQAAREKAIAAFESAYASYVDANATRDVARLRRELLALGVRKRQPTVARPDRGWPSLTSAELRVVRVVADGSTNREAAAQLYLSPDTVNTHLRHAFAKLGIRSRVELARLMLSHPPDQSR